MANELQGKRVAFLFTEGVERVELTEPLEAVREAGAEVDLISLEVEEIAKGRHLTVSSAAGHAGESRR